jgi:hypothetical protein
MRQYYDTFPHEKQQGFPGTINVILTMFGTVSDCFTHNYE